MPFCCVRCGTYVYLYCIFIPNSHLKLAVDPESATSGCFVRFVVIDADSRHRLTLAKSAWAIRGITSPRIWTVEPRTASNPWCMVLYLSPQSTGANRNGAKRHYQRAKILQAPSFRLQVMCGLPMTPWNGLKVPGV